MILTIALAVLIGLSLGLLGGGGTILTVPILLYAAKLEPKQAIATSLLVVALAATLGAVRQWKQVNVRTGLLFGAAGMVGAYGGGRAAHYVPAEVILLLFAAMMLATAVMMLRSKEQPLTPVERAPHHRPIGRILLEGVSVGAITGLVGAGGGFLVVPALALLGGLPMREAIATSLLVIAMKSFAGFAGYLGHVDINWTLALAVSGAAMIGSLGGAKLGAKISPALLRRGFAYFVIVMAIYLVSQELPDAVRGHQLFQSLFVERWPWWVGGSAIAAIALTFVYFQNQALGVSTGCAELCDPKSLKKTGATWRTYFLGGILLGGLLAGRLGGIDPSLALGHFDTLLSSSLWVKIPLLLTAGTLIGFGARQAGGCTSGHAIVGVALGAKSSLIATAMFMVFGFATVQTLVLLFGGR